jgi:putative transposase
MGQIARLVVPGYPHHVTQRGSRNKAIFFEDGDQQIYCDMVGEQLHKHRVEVWAYCLTPNHIAPYPDSARNRGHEPCPGKSTSPVYQLRPCALPLDRSLFQSRYDSVARDDSHWKAAVSYVSLNPVRAQFVFRAEEWAWSSVRAHLAGKDDGFVSVNPVLGPGSLADFSRVLVGWL